jgi:hypothetical protein
LPKLGTCRQNFSGDTYQGGRRGKHYHYKQGNIVEKLRLEFWQKNSGPYGAKNPGIILPLQKLSPNQQTAVQH